MTLFFFTKGHETRKSFLLSEFLVVFFFTLVFVFCNIPPQPPHRLAWSGEKSPGDGGEKKKQKPTNCQLLEGRHNVSMTVPVLFLVAPKTRGPFFFSLCFIASLRHDCFFTFAFPQASF